MFWYFFRIAKINAYNYLKKTLKNISKCAFDVMKLNTYIKAGISFTPFTPEYGFETLIKSNYHKISVQVHPNIRVIINYIKRELEYPSTPLTCMPKPMPSLQIFLQADILSQSNQSSIIQFIKQPHIYIGIQKNLITFTPQPRLLNSQSVVFKKMQTKTYYNLFEPPLIPRCEFDLIVLPHISSISLTTITGLLSIITNITSQLQFISPTIFPISNNSSIEANFPFIKPKIISPLSKSVLSFDSDVIHNINYIGNQLLFSPFPLLLQTSRIEFPESIKSIQYSVKVILQEIISSPLSRSTIIFDPTIPIKDITNQQQIISTLGVFSPTIIEKLLKFNTLVNLEDIISNPIKLTTISFMKQIPKKVENLISTSVSNQTAPKIKSQNIQTISYLNDYLVVTANNLPFSLFWDVNPIIILNQAISSFPITQSISNFLSPISFHSVDQIIAHPCYISPKEISRLVAITILIHYNIFEPPEIPLCEFRPISLIFPHFTISFINTNIGISSTQISSIILDLLYRINSQKSTYSITSLDSSPLHVQSISISALNQIPLQSNQIAIIPYED